METTTLSEQTFKNPAYEKGCGKKCATAEKLAIYHGHGLFKLSELEPGAVEPVKQAIKKRVAEWKEHYTKYGD